MALNAEKLDRDLTRHMEARVSGHRLPGCSALVWEKGKTVFEKTVGYADVFTGEKLKKDSIFRLCSMTKAVTAVALMTMVDAGRIALDDPVSKYIPAFGRGRVAIVKEGKIVGSTEAVRPLLVADLLSHTAGFGCGEATRLQNAERPFGFMSLEAAVDFWSLALRDFEPHTAWGYSATASFDVAAGLCQKLADMPYAEYLEKTVLHPLGMSDTGYTLSEKRQQRIVTIAFYDEKEKILTPVPDRSDCFCRYPDGFWPDCYTAGGTSLFGTAADYLQFARMLLHRGAYEGGRILSESAFAEMLVPQLGAEMMGSDETVWGLSFLIRRKVSPTQPLPVGSYGWSGAYGTHFWVDPANEIIGLYFSNLRNAGGSGAATIPEIEGDVANALN